MTYALIAVVLVAIGFVVWLGVRSYKAGKSAQREADLDHALTVEKRMADAATDAPDSLKGVTAAARKGEF